MVFFDTDFKWYLCWQGIKIIIIFFTLNGIIFLQVHLIWHLIWSLSINVMIKLSWAVCTIHYTVGKAENYCSTCLMNWYDNCHLSQLFSIQNTALYQKLVHNCTIFLCSLDVRNIVQAGDPLYAGFLSTQGSGGYTWPKWVQFFCKKQLSRVWTREEEK